MRRANHTLNMDWIYVKNSDLECLLNKPQLDMLKSASLASAGHDILKDIISTVVSRIRAEIAAGNISRLSTDHSKIPPELKECALALSLEMLQSRIPDMPMPDSILRRAENARSTLLRISSGSLPVSAPLYGISAASKKAIFAKRMRRPNFTSKTMQGL